VTPTEFKSARNALGMSANQMARALGVHEGRTVRRWQDGTQDVPGPVAVAVAYMLRERGLTPEAFGAATPS
jgi:DNA-binding transcriptional regulator YiaG